MSSTVAEISLPALRHNLYEVARRVGSSAILAVVKADAYGHGAILVARALLEAGASRLGVATVKEALELRNAGITSPILVMGGALLAEELSAVLRHNLILVLPSREAVDELGRYANRVAPIPVHLKIDTGMGRLGLSPEEARSLLTSCWPAGLYLEGLMSHLARADEIDEAATNEQLGQFRGLLASLKESGIVIPIAHIASTAGILRYPASHFDMVRPGLMLYGYAPGATPADGLRPVLTWKAHVVQVKRVRPGQSVSYGGTFVANRPMTLAILGVGYADGFNRGLSNKGCVLINGHTARVVGRVCMDLTVVDVTEIPSVSVRDEAVLIGQQGSARLTADDLASQLGTISYEMLSQIGRRVVRVYRED